jgi:iron complex outermembrane receptor protein
MKIHEAQGVGIDRQRRQSGRLRSHTGRGGSVFARTICAHGAGVACAFWVSSGWAQAPSPTPEPPAGEAPAPAPEADPAPPPAPDPAPGVASPADQQTLNAEGAVDVGAAEAEPLPEDVPEDLSPGGPMDEVIVTVDRRKKDLQDYSGTASAFTESQLRNLGVSSVTQMSQVVPGLQIGHTDQGKATIYIRGVGSDNTTELGDQAVAVHVDNVYLPRFRGMSSAWLDVERVEVNSGPQGTVRGRNATGGSINIISKPAVFSEFQTMAEVTYGTYRQRQFQGMLNIPLGDSVAIRVAGMSNSMDPTWENEGPIGHIPGAQDANDYAAKGQLRIKPSSRMDITIAGDYTLQRSLGWVGSNMIGLLNNTDDVNNTPDDLSDDPVVPIDPNSIDNPRRVYQRGRYPSAESKHWGVRLNVNYDTGPVNIELLGSYRYLNWLQYGGTNAGFFESAQDIANQNWDSWSYAQQQNDDSKSGVGELRFASPDDQRVVWSVGGFGMYEDQGAFLGQVQGDPDGNFNEFNMPSTKVWSMAGYGDVTFKITDDFRLLAGLRFTREHKDRLGGLWMIGGSGLPQEGNQLCARVNAATGECVEFGLASNDIGRFGTEGFNFRGLSRDNYNIPGPDATQEERVNFFLDGIESFGVRDQMAIAICNDPVAQLQQPADPAQAPRPISTGRLTQDENGNFRCANGIRQSILNSDQTFTLTRPQNGERDDSYFDFRAGLEYDLADDNLLYATVSSGHKAGGFNDSIPDPDVEDAFITPDYGVETVYALEIGSKNVLADRRLRLNASAFAYMYDGMQFQTIITVGTAPPLQPNGMPAIDPITNMPFPDTRGAVAARQNAEKAAMMYGLDVDAVYALPAGLEVDLHALFQDSRFPDGTYVNDGRLGLGDANAQVDLGGYWLPRVSPYTFNYSLSQLIFTGIGNFDWVIQGQTRGRHFMTPYNGDGTRLAPRGPEWGLNRDGTVSNMGAGLTRETNQQLGIIEDNVQRLDDEVPTYTVFNLGVGWRRSDGLLSIRGFVNNVFNIAYATTIASTSGNNIRFYNDPLMAGVRVRMDF